MDRCRFCLQPIDQENPLPSVPALKDEDGPPLDEYKVVRHPKVAILGTDEKQQLILENYSLYDQQGHLVPINDELLGLRQTKLHFNGIVRGSFSTDHNDKVQVQAAGPITEWWITGFSRGETPTVGISTDLADYYLKVPSDSYKSIYKDLEEKVLLTKVVYGILDDVKDEGGLQGFSYEDMLSRLASQDENDVNEETLLQHGQFIIQQIHSFDSYAEDQEERVTSAPFFKDFKKYVGVEVIDLESEVVNDEGPPAKRQRNEQFSDSLGLGTGNFKPKSVSKATTTILVRRIFEKFFKTAISNRVPAAEVPASKNGFCGVCHGCQWKDCGSCRNCLQMKKFGGTSSDDDFICLDKVCTKNGLLPDKAARILAGQISLNKMREQQNLRKVKWLDPCPNIDSIAGKSEKNYLAVKINGEKIAVGDFVYVTPDDACTARYVVKIVRLFHDYSVTETYGLENKLAHVQKFCFGNDTVLGETAEERELFLLSDCETIQLIDVEGKVEVAYWSGPSNFHQIGNTVESVITPSDEIKERYWFRLRYEPTLCRFEVINRKMLEVQNCYPCEMWRQRSARLTPSLEKEGDQYVFKYEGEDYRVGDGIYLMPNTLEGVKNKTIKKGTGYLVRDKTKDPTIYTEYYRKFLKTIESIKGSINNFPEPFDIGVITNIRPSKGNGGKPRIKVRKMFRPENIQNVEELREMAGITEFQAINYLYLTNEYEYIPDEFLSSVSGKCEVKHRGVIDETPFKWSLDNRNRFFYDCVYDIQNHEINRISASVKNEEETKHPLEVENEVSKDHCDTDSRDNKLEKKAIAEEKEPVNLSEGLKVNNIRPLRTMDVYAGVGGLSVGLEQAKVVKTQWAIEYVPEAARAFKRNHPECEVMLEDCNTILRHALKGHTHVKKWKIPTKGEVELLAGGPPCQGFSIMNKFNEREYSTFKNSQISTFLSFCDYYRPKFFILENVKNLGSFKNSMVLKLCMKVLVQMGYQCTFGILQAGHYGVPQTRRRIFIVAAAPGEILPHYPTPTHVFESTDQTVKVDKKSFSLGVCWSNSAPLRCNTVCDALTDLLKIEHVDDPDPLLLIKYQSEPLSTYQQLMRYRPKHDFLDEVTDHVVKRVDSIYKLRFRHIPTEPGADWRDLPNMNLENARKLRYYYKDVSGPKHNPYDAVCVCGTGKKKCNPMDEQKQTLIPWFLPHTAHKNNQWAGLYGRIHWNGYFSTTVTDPSPGGKQGRVLHPDQHRLVSVRECARSQGFPDSFQFDGSIKDRYRQIGNAVPPPLAKAVGLEIRKSLETKLKNNL